MCIKILVVFLLCLPVRSFSVSFVFPPDAGIVDVTKSPYNVVPNSGSDVTAAIQKALDDHANGNRIIYLPDGTYLISNTLRWGDGAHGGLAQKRTAMQGQSRDGTIIRLKDNCAGFQNPSSPKAMIWTGNRPAQRFRNSIWSLTVNTGRGNPGASGIQFNTSNQGTMRHVKIVSGDGQGVNGLDVNFTDEIGPGYIYDLEVIGFDYGVGAYVLNSLTFEKIVLRNQNKIGFANDRHVVSIRGLTSENSVPAVRNNGEMVLVDAHLTGIGAASGVAAITSNGSIYLRSVSAPGYARTLENTKGHKRSIDSETAHEYVSHDPVTQFNTGTSSLNLPIKDAPEVPWDPIEDWVNPMDFGAKGDGTTDDGPAIQNAIDAGKTTLFFPGGRSFKFSTFTIRGNIRRVIGCEGRLRNGTIIFADGTHPAVVFERFNSLYYSVKLKHRASRTLVMRSCTSIEVIGEGTGDLFLEDICVSPFLFNNPGQNIWARQINPEDHHNTNIVNNGATLWVLGLKTERGSVKLETKNGGRTEVLGGHIYATSGEKTTPLFTINNATASFAIVRQTCYNNNWFNDIVRETQDGVTKTLTRQTSGANLFLYVSKQTDSPVSVITAPKTHRMNTAAAKLLFYGNSTGTGLDKNAEQFNLRGNRVPHHKNQSHGIRIVREIVRDK